MIVINGKVYNGSSVTINNNRVIVDGIIQGDDLASVKEINIDAKGFRGHLSVQGDVKVLGNIDGQVKTQGSVSANNIYGDVSAGGSVNCDDIKGNASAGGSINCDDIGGNAMAGGSIRKG